MAGIPGTDPNETGTQADHRVMRETVVNMRRMIGRLSAMPFTEDVSFLLAVTRTNLSAIITIHPELG